MLLYIQREVKFIVKSCTNPQEHKVYNKGLDTQYICFFRNLVLLDLLMLRHENRRFLCILYKFYKME